MITVSSPDLTPDMSPIEGEATAPAGTGAEARRAPTSIQMSYASHYRPDQLGPDAINYVDQVTKAMKNYGMKISVNYISTPKVTVVSVVDDSTKNAVNLLFGCSYHPTDNSPVASAAPEARLAVNRKDPTIQVQQSIVVIPEDYSRASQMAAFLANFFTNLKDFVMKDDISVSMLKNNRFKIITDIDRVRAFVNMYSPHAVRARDDIGFLLYYENEEHGPGGRQVVQEEFMAVTGYTRFLKDANCQLGAPLRYQPTVVITDIVCPLPNANLISLALATAVNVFISNGMSWTRPYSSCAKGMPNLGNLITINGAPQPATTPEQLRSIIYNYMNQPWLAIDVPEGRARLHAIDLLTVDNGRPMFKHILNFLAATTGEALPPELEQLGLVGNSFTNVTGVYQDQVLKDTRCVDYLSLIDKVRKPNEIEMFNIQTTNPADAFNAVKTIHVGESTRALYMHTTCLLVGAVVSWISDKLCQNDAMPIVDLATCGPVSLEYLMRNDAMTKYQSNLRMTGMNNGYGNYSIPYNFFGNRGY